MTRTQSLLRLALGAALLVSCAPAPAGLSAPRAGRVFDAHDGGNGAIALSISLQAARRVQSAIRPYGVADVNHLVVSLAKFDGSAYVPMLNTGGAPLTVDLAGPEIDGSVTLAGLRRNTSYQLQVKAYRNPGTAEDDLISLTDASSLAEVAIGADEAPEPLALQVSLINRAVTVALPGPAVGFAAPALQSDAALAYSEGARRYLLAWRDSRVNPGRPALFVQLLEVDGTPVGDPTRLSDGERAAGAPALAYDPERGRFLVVWPSQAQPTDYPGDPGANLLARAVSADGSPVGDAFVVDTPPIGSSQTAPALAFSPTDDAFVVAWEDDRLVHDNPDVLAKRIAAATLTPLGAPVSVDETAGGASRRTSPTLCWLPTDNRYAVAWVDDALTHGTVRYGRLGVQAGSLVPIGAVASLSSAADQRHPTLAHDALSGETLLAWDDARNALDLGRELYLQRLSGTFTPLGAETALLSPSEAIGNQDSPRAVFNAIAREYVLTWLDGSVQPGGDVFAGRLTAAGTAIGGKIAISPSGGEGAGPVIAQASDAASNSSLLLWSTNGHLVRRVLDSRYAP